MASPPIIEESAPSAPPHSDRKIRDARVRIDGKFFARGQERLRLQGVTYGPFAADGNHGPFPARAQAARDLAQMKAGGVNSFRTYHVPPEWLLELAQEHELNVFVDVPWSKHVCFLEDRRARQEARRAIRCAASLGRANPCILGCSIGNEIPTDVIRWHTARRVTRFLAELADVAKQADPDGLVTYASFPPTEYLDLPFLDFATFNVYLHDRGAFRRYLFRLQNLLGEKPLVMGEIGMDTLRHGEAAQAEFLAGHVREAVVLGLAGTFLFAWTDEWHTGGHAIRDWAFGITTADRAPKPACRALEAVFDHTPAALLEAAPRVSVVVCTYNGGRTLEECLGSLSRLEYPDYEVIVVDDGSTDDTRRILARFPDVRAIHQPNQGLSVARNVGLEAATGSIIAYTDSDCFADRDWLAHLVDQLERHDAAAVGGPNLTPDDGRLAACVAAAPGQPTHVLESDQVAEHIPGCNMAFRREALEAINGFDPQYRKAGDDVDVCWRLQQAGFWITYAPGAFVWHHRRQTPRAYLRQQFGYGEAEALLHFKHPDRFNGRGEGKWRGVLYGASLRGLRLRGPIIYRGTFGTGLFQCLYQPGPAHWAMLPGTLEWHLAAAALALAGFAWTGLLAVAGVMLGLAVLLAVLLATQARLAKEHGGLRSRAWIAALCYVQPLVRTWARYQTRLFSRCAPQVGASMEGGPRRRLSWTGRAQVAFWSESGGDRVAWLEAIVDYMNQHRWGKVLDSGWSGWDLEAYCCSGQVLKVITAQEEHGGGRRLMRVRCRLAPTPLYKFVAAAVFVGAAALAVTEPPAALVVSLVAVTAAIVAWIRGRRSAAHVLRLFHVVADGLQMVECPTTPVSKPDHATESVEPAREDSGQHKNRRRRRRRFRPRQPRRGQAGPAPWVPGQETEQQDFDLGPDES